MIRQIDAAFACAPGELFSIIALASLALVRARRVVGSSPATFTEMELVLPTKFAIIYEGAGAHADRDRVVLLTDAGAGLAIVPVGDVEDVPAVARSLVSEKTNAIQLCGGMPASTRAQVTAELAGQVAVGAVTFGVESLDRTSDCSAAFARGTPPREAFIIVLPDLEEKRFAKAYPPQDTTFVIVADNDGAAQVAAELVGAGVGLIELYGAATAATAAAVIAAVEGRAAVGLIGYDGFSVGAR